MFYKYDEICKLAEYGRKQHGWTDYPLRLAAKKMNHTFSSYKMSHLEQHIQVGYGSSENAVLDELDEEKLIDYLSKIGYIGKLWPASKKETRLEIVAVLTDTIDTCLEQIAYRFDLWMTKAEFVKLLEENNIMVFKTVEDYDKYKRKIEEELRIMNNFEITQKTYESIRSRAVAS